MYSLGKCRQLVHSLVYIKYKDKRYNGISVIHYIVYTLIIVSSLQQYICINGLLLYSTGYQENTNRFEGINEKEETNDIILFKKTKHK